MTTAHLEQVWRGCVPDVLAALVRGYGDFDAAEDAVQEALLAAARQWPIDGLPDSPRGWLITVASRRLVDQWRSERARAGREQLVARRDPAELQAPAADVAAAGERDDSLTLLLLCCHPALTRPSQVALTLRAVAGLSTAQIARAFLVPEATMAQRISRAKSRLRQVGARFGDPGAEQLPDRVAAAAHVLYLVFTEGHATSTGAGLVDVSLADEAIRLTRQLHEHLPAAGEVAGLLSLMLLTDARRAARVRHDGSLVPLAEQDRSRWDGPRIREGVGLVERALPTGPVGPFQLQAAIAAVHADAPRAEDTDWAQIETLYRMLHDLAPSPVVTLNHAVAVAMVDGAAAGLDLIGPLLRDRHMRRHHRLHAVRGHLLEMDGRVEEAPIRVRPGSSPGHQHPRAAVPQYQGRSARTRTSGDPGRGATRRADPSRAGREKPAEGTSCLTRSGSARWRSTAPMPGCWPRSTPRSPAGRSRSSTPPGPP